MENKKAKRMDMNMKKLLEYYYKREEQLRLAWFQKNEERLMEIANESTDTKEAAERIQKQLTVHLKKRFADPEKHITTTYDEDKPVDYDATLAAKNIMRPVDPEVKQLLYKGTQKEGRINYLKERYKIIPEERYYYPETTSFQYGWKMWDCAKELKSSRFGRQQVIRDSFYRRRGVGRDPDWYIEPAKLSPTICGGI